MIMNDGNESNRIARPEEMTTVATGTASTTMTMIGCNHNNDHGDVDATTAVTTTGSSATATTTATTSLGGGGGNDGVVASTNGNGNSSSSNSSSSSSNQNHHHHQHNNNNNNNGNATSSDTDSHTPILLSRLSHWRKQQQEQAVQLFRRTTTNILTPMTTVTTADPHNNHDDHLTNQQHPWRDRTGMVRSGGGGSTVQELLVATLSPANHPPVTPAFSSSSSLLDQDDDDVEQQQQQQPQEEDEEQQQQQTGEEEPQSRSHSYSTTTTSTTKDEEIHWNNNHHSNLIDNHDHDSNHYNDNDNDNQSSSSERDNGCSMTTGSSLAGGSTSTATSSSSTTTATATTTTSNTTGTQQHRGRSSLLPSSPWTTMAATVMENTARNFRGRYASAVVHHSHNNEYGHHDPDNKDDGTNHNKIINNDNNNDIHRGGNNDHNDNNIIHKNGYDPDTTPKASRFTHTSLSSFTASLTTNHTTRNTTTTTTTNTTTPQSAFPLAASLLSRTTKSLSSTSSLGVAFASGNGLAVNSPMATATTGMGSSSLSVSTTGVTATGNTTTTNTNTPQSTRILSSPAAEHFQSLTRALPPHQYIMLLGRGMLGVNLKQTFLQKQGVYVDFLVPHGAADRSGMIYVGDALVRVGTADIRKGTILTVPQTIAAATRPVHLILSTAGAQDLREECLSHVDLCIGWLGYSQWNNHHASASHATVPPRTQPPPPPPYSTDPIPPQRSKYRNEVPTEGGGGRGVDTTGHSDEAEKDIDEPQDEMTLISPTSFEDNDDDHEDDTGKHNKHEITMDSLNTVDQFLNPGQPRKPIRLALASHVARRNNEWVQLPIMEDDNTCNAVRNALLCTIADGRRFTYLSQHAADKDHQALLLLISELWQYMDHFPLCPRPMEMADRIAHKYFLPTKLNPGEWIPPVLDYHQLVASHTLRQLETALQSQNVTQDLFREFFVAAIDSLALQPPFLSFLISNDCARMRAYLRNTAPFVNVPLRQVWDSVTGVTTDPVGVAAGKNYIVFILVYLLCATDPEGVGENDDILIANGETQPGIRLEEAVTGFCAALFIYARVLPVLSTESSTNLQRASIIMQLWNTFLEVQDLAAGGSFISKLLVTFVDVCRQQDWVKVTDTAKALADELLWDYVRTYHPRFRMHKFHEWLCEEYLSTGNESIPHIVPSLPEQGIKRLLRKVKWPPGVTPHQPSHNLPGDTQDTSSCAVYNADCALVFGTVVGLDLMVQAPTPGMENIRRYACQGVAADPSNRLTPNDVLHTTESYAYVPESRIKPFSMSRQVKDRTVMVGGWGVSLVNFVIPRSDGSDGDSALYGVSLVLRECDDRSEGYAEDPCLDHSSLLDEIYGAVTNHCPLFLKRLGEKRLWSERVRSEVREGDSSRPVICLALVSRSNTILAMRETLVILASAFSYCGKRPGSIPELVDFLGCFAYQDIESNALWRILDPVMQRASAPWIERPLGSQKAQFLDQAGSELIQSLPPIPLALLFIAALLEQKIVFSSGRRSTLVSATMALTELLKPLQWCHLLVPRVPASLAADLIQYPAPYILGLSSEDAGMIELLRELPSDVTMVDLDVGRVILAPSFAHASELGRGIPNDAETANALRSQVLYLAQSLGSVWGPELDPTLWLSDCPPSPLSTSTLPGSSINDPSLRFQRLRHICSEFIEELVSGVPACCYWIAETSAIPLACGAGSSTTELTSGWNDPCTILFDEDRFFRFKALNYTKSKEEHVHLAVRDETTGSCFPTHPLFPTLLDDGRRDANITSNVTVSTGLLPTSRIATAAVSTMLSTVNTSSSSHYWALNLEDFDLVLELFLRCQSMNLYIGSRPKEEMAFYV